MKKKLLIACMLLRAGCIVIAQNPEDTYNLKVSQKLEMRGLTHVRYQLFDDSTKIDAFDLRRARLDFRGDVAPKFGYRLHLELAGTPKILDATMVFKPHELFNINLGQSKTPYCYDNLYGPWNLLTISRTQLDNALSNRDADMYGNQNGRDIGMWFSGKYSIGAEGARRPLIDYTIGVYNGSGINTADANQDKDLGAAIGFSPIKNLWVFGRYYTGVGRTALVPTTNANRERFGSNITYKYKDFLLEAEYLGGSDVSDSLSLRERSGYYVTIGYSPIKDQLQVIARIDSYDQNIRAENDIINKYVLATSYFFTKNTRIQLEYDIVVEEDADNQIRNNVFAIQAQVGF